jgi:DNA-binding protein Fis
VDAQLASTNEGDLSYDTLLDQLEAVLMQHLLDRHQGKPTHLANAMRMNRTTLRQKLRRLGIADSADA